MIIPSMTWKEMYIGLETDAHKVKIRIEKSYPKAIKFFQKSSNFPVWYIDEYKIPSTNNLHIIFYYARNTNDIKNPLCSSFCVVFSDNKRYVIRGLKMGYQHSPKSKTIMLPQIHAYTSHFLQRYKERFLRNDKLTPNEVAGLFLVRNYLPMPIMLNENVNEHFRDHGPHNDRGMRVLDGFCFTQTAIEGKESEDGIREHDRVDAMLILYTTFMNESDMSKTQRIAIDKEHIETIKRFMKELHSYPIDSMR